MIRAILLLMIIYVSAYSAEHKPFISTDIASVVTFDAPYDSVLGNGVRHRAIIRSQIGNDDYKLLMIEKIVPGKFGSSDKVLFSFETFVNEIPKIKEYIKELTDKSAEAAAGCCDIKNLAWKAEKLWFTVTHKSITFQCSTTGLVKEEFKFDCLKLQE
jgi:hypothetical protein